ncbi:MAG: PBP1 and LysM peptidoglycan-binding domain-containing protein [Flavobacteriales bacterium]
MMNQRSTRSLPLQSGMILMVMLTFVLGLHAQQVPNASLDSPQLHGVQSGETLYSIARQYNLSVQDLLKLNPNCRETLSIGQFLIVSEDLPSLGTSVEQTERDSVRRDSVIHDAVILDSILAIDSMDIQLDVEMIIADSTSLNPDLQDAVALSWDSIPFLVGDAPVLSSDTLRALVVLPFMLSSSRSESTTARNKAMKLRTYAEDYLHGIQWGAQMLSDSGYAISLRVRDSEVWCEKDSVSMISDLIWSNVVLGPLRKSELTQISSILQHHPKPQWTLINQELKDEELNPALFCLDFSEQQAMHVMATYAADSAKTDSSRPVILVRTGGEDAKLEKEFKKEFLKQSADSSRLVILDGDIQFAEGLASKVKRLDNPLVVIAAGESARSLYSYVQTELGQLEDTVRYQVLAHPKTINFDLDWNFLNHAHWSIPSVTSNDPWKSTESFAEIKTYRKLFGIDPSDVAIKGCDAIIESAKWQRLPWPLPQQIMHVPKWNWNPDLRQYVNENCFILGYEDGAWLPVD